MQHTNIHTDNMTVQIMILWQDEAAPVAVRPAAVLSSQQQVYLLPVTRYSTTVLLIYFSCERTRTR